MGPLAPPSELKGGGTDARSPPCIRPCLTAFKKGEHLILLFLRLNVSLKQVEIMMTIFPRQTKSKTQIIWSLKLRLKCKGSNQRAINSKVAFQTMFYKKCFIQLKEVEQNFPVADTVNNI